MKLHKSMKFTEHVQVDKIQSSGSPIHQVDHSIKSMKGRPVNEVERFARHEIVARDSVDYGATCVHARDSIARV